MLMTTLPEYRLRPGLVREWTLDGEPFREAARSVRGTPLSYNQEWHLKFVSKLVERDVRTPPWLGFGFEIPGLLDVEAFRATLRAWVERHETLRSGFRVVDAKAERFTVDHDAVVVRDVVLGEFTSTEEISACLQGRIDGATDALNWPSYVVETVEHTDSTTVVVGMDHAHTDGFSVMISVEELQDLYAAISAGRPAPHRRVGSYVDYSVAERDAAGQIDADDPAVLRWARLVEDGGGRFPGFPLDLGVTEDVFLPHIRMDMTLLDGPEAEAVEEVCHAADGGFVAGLLAAFAISAYQLTGEPLYRTVMPVHTRFRPEWLHAMGWYIGIGAVEVELGGAASFRDVVPRAHRSARRAVRLGRVPFTRAMELLGMAADVERSMPEVCPFVSFSDMRVVPGEPRWTEWNARTLFRMTRGNKANIWVNRTGEGVQLMARYPDAETARAGIACFTDHVRDVLHNVTKTGDYVFDIRPNTTGVTV
ncbi:condensation domain-containing protein [Streptomyces sp. NPDC005202]|uniref:condensation domain-containing protein n=1 Tax=Streptomyces sp. NPDC005202 TaxID=3157021 RepID=UPI0033A5A77D